MANVPVDLRKYDLKQPPGHKVAIPRYTLRFPEGVTHAYTLYIGVQHHSSSASKAAAAVQQSIQHTLNLNKPEALDTFRVTEGFDVPNSRVWVAYWTCFEAFNAALEALDLVSLWRIIPSEEDRRSIGLWIEHCTTPLERLETNYSSLEHRPGLAGIEGTERLEHDLTGYWGAARDRIAASAEDQFVYCTGEHAKTAVPKGVGQRVTGRTWENMCHIRSGQYWATCPAAEREAYESQLEPALMQGMRYLWAHAAETGTLGLRFLRDPEEGKGETCGAGFFANWADQEKWASRHPSHLEIYSGSVRHAEAFGEERRFMTWHEVSILKDGEARFEYVNCVPETGVIKWVPMEVQQLV